MTRSEFSGNGGTASHSPGRSPMPREHSYRDMSYAQINAAYDNRRRVGNCQAIFDDWALRSEVVYARRRVYRDLRYGVHPRQRLDLFPASAPHRPTLLYLHGGYWQWNTKEEEAFIAEGPLSHEINVVLCEYRLCPEFGIGELLSDVSAAIDWIAPRLSRYGAHPDQLVVAGSSSGAHLAAMLLPRAEVCGALLVSGIYDLEPIRRSWLNEVIGLDKKDVQRLSPIRQIPRTTAKIALVVGSEESSEFRRQTLEYHRACLGRNISSLQRVLDGRDHFTVMDELASATGRLTGLLLQIYRQTL